MNHTLYYTLVDLCNVFCMISFPSTVCMASVEAVSVEVESASSVTVSWLPPDSQLWNGIITSYTMVYELMGRVDVQDNNMEPISSQTFSIPQAGMPLVNNPDPRIVTSPLQFESVVINSLEEFYVYRFTVFLENSVGQSDTSSSITVEMPASGNVQIHAARLCMANH